ncbi:hypothetical protein M9H77_17604 [Catharanthus roseus]|uniref:Uncharacterized protein n=1 Tax=Catharanthus roseus TaxID=4058 RepID=A0ACC0B538_CATRO|nr:hypothetical protein M9H77_17604 [Catharanthus roseus]
MQAYSDQLDNPSKNSIGPDNAFLRRWAKINLESFVFSVNLTDVYFTMPSHKASRNMLLRFEEEIKEMRENISAEIARLKEMIVQNTSTPSNSTHFNEHVPIRDKHKSFRYMTVERLLLTMKHFIFLYIVRQCVINHSLVVAKGVVRSVDPFRHVREEELGECWSKVHANIPLK